MVTIIKMMMLRLLHFFLLLFLLSCAETHENEDHLSEFDFPINLPKNEFSANNAFAFSSLETDTMIIGSTFKAKVFLANHRYVYDRDSIEPIINYSYGDSTSIWDMKKVSVPAEEVNDTGYVKFEVKDNALKKGQTKKKVFMPT